MLALTRDSSLGHIPPAIFRWCGYPASASNEITPNASRYPLWGPIPLTYSRYGGSGTGREASGSRSGAAPRWATWMRRGSRPPYSAAADAVYDEIAMMLSALAM